MIEFTLSRVALCICGAVMLAGVLSPFLSIMEDGQDERVQEQTDSIAVMIDTFYESDADYMTVSMDDILPSIASSVAFEGCLVKVTYEGQEYVSATRFSVTANEGSYGCNDIVKFVKTDGPIKAERIN